MVREEQTDIELIANFQSGCIESFEEIVRRYETKVHNLATRLTRNTEDAEEVLQDVFVTVYRKIASFEGKAKFSSWLYRITVNAAFMKLRKRKQDPAVSLTDLLPQLQNTNDFAPQLVPSWSESCDSRAFGNEIRAALQAAISKLPSDYRAVFILRDVDGLANKEVSDILGLSIPAVKSRLHRSRLMLRKRLSRFYQDYRSDDKVVSIGPSLMKQAA